MAKYLLTRNQAFTDHAGKPGDIIEVGDPTDERWAQLINRGILVAKSGEAPKAKRGRGLVQGGPPPAPTDEGGASGDGQTTGDSDTESATIASETSEPEA
jgi:hypothetical protein